MKVRGLSPVVFGFGALTLALGGCFKAPSAVRPLDLADQAFARGDYLEAQAGYRLAGENAASPGEAARTRLMALLARRGTSSPEELDALLSDLRTFAVSAAETPWGRMAQLYADEMAQVDALRWAVQRSGAEISLLERELAEFKDALARTEQLVTELTAQLQTSRDERAQLQRTLKEREEDAALQGARIAELEAELEALKSIDMSRSP